MSAAYVIDPETCIDVQRAPEFVRQEQSAVNGSSRMLLILSSASAAAPVPRSVRSVQLHRVKKRD